jgi:hypothetical protein
LDLFYYSIKAIRQKYPNNPNNDSDVYQVNFNWTWNGYEGCGKIDFYKSTSSLCNKFGENESEMSISSNSKRKQPNGRNTCSLYNDKSLSQLFELILSKINLSNTMSYDEWINGIK